MSATDYKYEIRDDLLVIICGAAATVPGVTNFIACTSEKLSGSRYHLLIIDTVSDIIPTVGDITALCDSVALDTNLRDKIAVCVASVVQVGMGKVLLSVFSHPIVTLKIFTNEDNAVTWLKSD